MFDQAVDQAGGEAVAAADAVEDLQVRLGGVASTKLAAGPAIAPQSLTVARADGAQRGGDDLEVRERRRRPARSSPRRRCTSSSVRLASTPSTSKPRQAVKSSSLPIITSTRGASLRLTSRRPFRSADGLPQAGPVVEVVGDDGAVRALRRSRPPSITSGVVSERAAKMPPVWNQRTPSVAEQMRPSRRRPA